MVHQNGPLVKRLRHRPLTPVTPVRFWYGSPNFKSVLIAVRSHPFPFRTRKLSSFASMILGWRRPGKVDQCRHRYSSLAQSVEHSAVNRVVARSSRAGGAKERLQQQAFLFFYGFVKASLIRSAGCSVFAWAQNWPVFASLRSNMTSNIVILKGSQCAFWRLSARI